MRSSLLSPLAPLLVALLGCAGTSSTAATNDAATTGAAATTATATPTATATDAPAKGPATVAAPAGSTAGTAERPAAPGPAAGGASCDVAKVATWGSCVDKVVTITGKDPGPNVHQHPMMVGPPSISGGRTQEYMDVANGTQIILIVKKPVTCTGPMEATGTLKGISLGGPAGTKESYSGYYLEDASVKCL